MSRGNPRGNNSYKARGQGAVRGTVLRTTAAPEVAVQRIEVTRHEKGKEGAIPNKGKYWVDCAVDEDGDENLDLSGELGEERHTDCSFTDDL